MYDICIKMCDSNNLSEMRILVLICLLTISFCNVQAQVRDQELTDRLDADFKRWLWIKRIIADTAKVMQSEVAQVKKMKLTTSSVLLLR